MKERELKLEELRIGNWFYRDYSDLAYYVPNENSQLSKNDIKIWLDIDYWDNVPRGIPLTEEWLIKFGFIKHEKSIYGFKFIIGIADWGYTIENSFEEGRWFFGHEYYDAPDENENFKSMHFSYHIEYVHQLQNLYFALTGEELEIHTPDL